MKKLLLFALMAWVVASARADLIVGSLGGLTNATGDATNGGQTRQYAWTTSGGEVTVTYTLDLVGTGASLTNSFAFDNLFREPASANINFPSGDSLEITIDSIAANEGWTLNSVVKSDTVAVGNSHATEAVQFAVNGGTPWVVALTGSGGTETLTDTRFAAFDSAGDTLSFTPTAGSGGAAGVNLRDISFTFDVTVVPEPSTMAVVVLGALLLALRRR